jgi:hypothetical protein
LGEYGPLRVAVQLSTSSCQVSASCSYDFAFRGAPFLRATSAAQMRPAISVAIVFGENPLWFSQRSLSLSGPLAAM